MPMPPDIHREASGTRSRIGMIPAMKTTMKRMVESFQWLWQSGNEPKHIHRSPLIPDAKTVDTTTNQTPISMYAAPKKRRNPGLIKGDRE